MLHRARRACSRRSAPLRSGRGAARRGLELGHHVGGDAVAHEPGDHACDEPHGERRANRTRRARRGPRGRDDRGRDVRGARWSEVRNGREAAQDGDRRRGRRASRIGERVEVLARHRMRRRFVVVHDRAGRVRPRDAALVVRPRGPGLAIERDGPAARHRPELSANTRRADRTDRRTWSDRRVVRRERGAGGLPGRDGTRVRSRRSTHARPTEREKRRHVLVDRLDRVVAHRRRDRSGDGSRRSSRYGESKLTRVPWEDERHIQGASKHGTYHRGCVAIPGVFRSGRRGREPTCAHWIRAAPSPRRSAFRATCANARSRRSARATRRRCARAERRPPAGPLRRPAEPSRHRWRWLPEASLPW